MITPEWINTQIGFLNFRLGLYRPSTGRDFFFDPTPEFYAFISQGSTAALNKAMRILADFIIALSSPVIEDWDGPANPLTTWDHDWSEQKDPPGMIHYNGPFHSRVRIAITNKHTPHIMGGILAHELTHHFLANKNIAYPDDGENERLTDFATVFLGLGKLTLNGYESIQWSIPRPDKVVTYTYKIGYLSSRDIADVMVRVCAFRSIRLQDAQANLTATALGHLAAAALYEQRLQDWQANLTGTARGHLAAATFYKQRKQKDQERNARRAQRKKQWKRFLARIFRRQPEQHRNITTPSSQEPREKKESPKRVIECIACGQKLLVPDSKQAVRVSCRACGKIFVIAVRAGNGY
jgi:ribosomal protein S27E